MKGKKRRQGPLDDQTPGFSDMLLTLQNTILRNNEGITSKKIPGWNGLFRREKEVIGKKKKKEIAERNFSSSTIF